MCLSTVIALGQDPTKVEPRHYKRDFENERVDVVSVHYGPHEKSALHDHPGGEEVFVVEGDLRVGADRLTAGDYLYTPPSGKHAVASEGGCVLLVSTSQPVRIVEPRG